MTETVEQMCERVLKEYGDLKPTHAQEQKKMIKDVLDFIVTSVKQKSLLFNHLFEEVSFVGSYYEGVKTTLPREYDVIIAFKFPGVDLNKLQISTENCKDGFVSIGGFSSALSSMPGIWSSWKTSMEKWCDAEGNLLPGKIRSWCEGQIRSFVHRKRELISELFQLEFLFVKRTGPVTILQIRRQNGFDIDIELLPCIQFTNLFPPNPVRPVRCPNIPWGVVPRTKPRIWRKKNSNRTLRQYGLSNLVLQRETPGKPDPTFSLFEINSRLEDGRSQNKIQLQYKIPYLPRTERLPETVAETDVVIETGIEWRLSFNVHEKTLIKEKQRLKPAIRMIKRLRDVKGWRLTSQHLKTAALWALEDYDWDSLSLYDTFVTLLKRLQSCISQHCLKYYWDKRINLFKESNINFKTRLLMKDSLAKIIRKIEQDPWEIEKVLAKRQVD